MTKHVLLSETQHRDLRVHTGRGAAYGDGVMGVPAMPSEFRNLVADYPIFLHRDKDTGKYQPMAMFGLERGENLFLEGEHWNADYIPLMMQRGPFLIGFRQAEPGMSAKREMMVAIDMDHPRVGGKGELLFQPFGGNSEYLEKILNVLQQIDQGQAASDALMHELAQHDLIEPFTLELHFASKPRRLRGFHTINEEKLAALDADVLADFSRRGVLLAAHTIVASMANLPKLIRLKGDGGGAAPAAAPQTTTGAAPPASAGAAPPAAAPVVGITDNPAPIVPAVPSSRSGERSGSGSVPVAQLADFTAGVLPAALGDKPLHLKGFLEHWPSVQAARQGDRALLDYLRRLHKGLKQDKDILLFHGAPEHGGRFFYNADLTGFNFDRVTTRLSAVLDRMGAEDWGREGGDHFYIGSSSVRDYFPGFIDENPIDFGAGNAGQHDKGQRKDGQHSGQRNGLNDSLDNSGRLNPLVSIWMGNRSRIAAHFDTPDNLVCVVGGRRRFTLFPPGQIANLYVGPIDFTPAGQAISLVDFAQPDFERFPRFREALAAAQVVELEPGDALYLPALWWHHVESLSRLNAMVNYWWSPAGATGSPSDALMHAILCLRDLPPAQRAAWAEQFKYYVFSAGEGAAGASGVGDIGAGTSGQGADLSHIPEARRGILGKLDAATKQKWQATLSNLLRPS